MEERLKIVMTQVLDLGPDAAIENASPDTVAGWDSLRHMSLITALEDEFGIEFDDDDIVNMVSYERIVLTLQAKLS